MALVHCVDQGTTVTSGNVTTTWSGSTLEHNVVPAYPVGSKEKEILDPPDLSDGGVDYVSNVKRTNMASLGQSAVPFALYLNAMHNRIHPLFADQFIGSLAQRPVKDPINDTRRFANVEIVLSREGLIVQIGIVKASGVPEFDTAAIDAVTRAQPYGPAPDAIVSPDGNVYMHWGFHRDETYACSTMNVRPILLKAAPSTVVDAGVVSL